MGRGKVRKGWGGGGEGWRGEGGGSLPVSEVVLPPCTNSVCVGMEVVCNQS